MTHRRRVWASFVILLALVAYSTGIPCGAGKTCPAEAPRCCSKVKSVPVGTCQKKCGSGFQQRAFSFKRPTKPGLKQDQSLSPKPKPKVDDAKILPVHVGKSTDNKFAFIMDRFVTVVDGVPLFLSTGSSNSGDDNFKATWLPFCGFACHALFGWLGWSPEDMYAMAPTLKTRMKAIFDKKAQAFKDVSGAAGRIDKDTGRFEPLINTGVGFDKCDVDSDLIPASPTFEKTQKALELAMEAHKGHRASRVVALLKRFKTEKQLYLSSVLGNAHKADQWHVDPSLKLLRQEMMKLPVFQAFSHIQIPRAPYSDNAQCEGWGPFKGTDVLATFAQGNDWLASHGFAFTTWTGGEDGQISEYARDVKASVEAWNRKFWPVLQPTPSKKSAPSQKPTPSKPDKKPYDPLQSPTLDTDFHCRKRSSTCRMGPPPYRLFYINAFATDGDGASGRCLEGPKLRGARVLNYDAPLRKGVVFNMKVGARGARTRVCCKQDDRHLAQEFDMPSIRQNAKNVRGYWNCARP